MAVCGILLASFFAGATLVVADDLCYWRGHYKTCYGDFAYCCGLHGFDCCDDGYYVYSAWWFWLIWVFVIIFIMACSYVVRRRCLATRNGTVIIQRTIVPPPETYGTTGTTVYGTTYGTQTPQYNAAAPPLYQVQRARSMDEPMESDERYPVQVRPDRALSEPVDSGYGRDSCRLPKQESGEGRKGACGGPSLTASFSSTSSVSFPRFSQSSTEDHIEEEFFCEESKQFWYAVKGSSAEFKIYFHFVTAMKNSFPNDPLATQLKNNRVLKLIKHVFGIKGDKRDEVQVGRFVLLLGWFGPFKADAQGHCVCLAQIQALIDGSTTYRVGNRLESWFAGLMSQDEAGRRLRGQKRNMFLVRFSESLSEEGGFSVGLSVGEDQEPVHFNIKGNPTAAAATVPFDACLEFVPDRDPAKTYPDLVMLVNKRLTSGNPVYGDAFCVRPCPDLPLNVTFTGYEENGGRQ